MAKDNNIKEVRSIMIDAMQRLLNPDKDSPMDIQTAKAIADLGQTVVNSAKVEVDAIEALTRAGYVPEGTGFIMGKEKSLIQ